MDVYEHTMYGKNKMCFGAGESLTYCLSMKMNRDNLYSFVTCMKKTKTNLFFG